VKRWVDLYQAHQEVRLAAGEEATADIRKRLTELVDRKICDGSLPHRFTYDKASPKGLRVWYIAGAEDGEPLHNLPDLLDARLTVLLLIGTRRYELHELTVMLRGRTLGDNPWCVAVHVQNDQGAAGDHGGSGACGHAVLHCHVGPDLDQQPEVRVPLPPLLPAEVLDWVLSQVVPGYESAPWASVDAALAARGAAERSEAARAVSTIGLLGGTSW
jgi:hypothetical protein